MLRDGATKQETEGEASASSDLERWLLCVACRAEIARDDARIAASSGSATAHEHVFLNPSGLEFRLGCFASAPGARPEGERSTVWSWFPGHAWQASVCHACGMHLGWSFHATRGSSPESAESGAVFWGLILDRLASP